MNSNDPTEAVRRAMVKEISGNPSERELLEAQYGQVWDTQELQQDFTVHGFLAPFISVTRKSDGLKGLMTFQHGPRYYFSFKEDE